MKLAVAIVGYRTWPDGSVEVQVKDLNAAYSKLSKEYPDLCGPTRVPRSIGLVVMGHSSGAHIGLIMIVEQTEKVILWNESKTRIKNKRLKDASVPLVDKFVGLSGPYSISDHFDYEAARGVEELSPMKAACGYSREQFRLNSPALRLQDFLVSIDEHGDLCPEAFFPRTLLLTGIEDSVVPFTATCCAAQALRSCGVSNCNEIYIPSAGHEDTVIQLMLGGRISKEVTEWLVGAKGEDPPLSKL